MRKRMLLSVLTMLSVLAVLGCAGQAEELVMPSDLQIIETEAFYGDSSIGDVVLNEGIKEIRSRAFVGSGLSSINLPSSLTLIAEDAFDGPETVRVSVSEGTYAYEWAVSHGYLFPVQLAPKGLNRKLTVKWEAADRAVSYNVYYGTERNIASATEITGIAADTLSYTITDLQPGTIYYTWVRAVTDQCVTAASNMKYAITFPAAPTVSAPVVSSNSIALTWSESKGASLYRLHYGTTNDYDASSEIDGLKTTTYTLEDLDWGTKYYFWVEAANASGGLRKTTAETAVTEPDPAAPEQKAAKAYLRQITVSWEAVQGAESYLVYYGTSDEIGQATEMAGITDTSCVIADLQAGTTYYTWVKAVKATGTTGASNAQHVITYPSAPELKTPEVSGNTVSLSWEPVTGAAVYRLHYSTKNDYNTSVRIDSIRTTSYTISGLDFNTTYYIWISSANASGGMRTGTAVEAVTGDAGTMTPSQKDSKGGMEKVTVAWEAVEGADSYTVCYHTAGDVTKAKVVEGITGESYTLTELEPGTVYYTWVKSVSAGETSMPSNMKSVITSPAVPVMNAPLVSGNSITLNWNAAKGATIYRLRYGTSSNYSEATGFIDNIKDTTYTISDLDYNSEYYIWITAANTSGGVRNTVAKTATTEAAPN